MIAGEAVRELEAIEGASLLDRVVERAVEIVRILEDDTPQRVFELIDLHSMNSPEAAYNASGIVFSPLHPKPSAVRASQLLEFAVNSDDEDIRHGAQYCLGLCYSGMHGREADALKYIRTAAENGVPEAGVTLGNFHLSGFGPLEPDIGEAADRYYGTWMKHDDDSAAFALVRLMLQHPDLDWSSYDIDPMEMLYDLSDGGYHAASLLVDEIEDDDDDGDVAVLSERIVPEDPSRPARVTGALVNEFDIAVSDAETLTAGLYGFDTWQELKSAIANPPDDPGPADEDCVGGRRSRRIREQAAILMHHMDIGDTAADVAVSLLRPTARTGRPSLKGLDARMAKIAPPEEGMMAAMRGILGSFGGFDPVSAIKATSEGAPIHPDAWLSVLREVMGWKFDDLKRENTNHGTIIGAVSSGGRTFPVHLSSVVYIPGDMNESVTALEELASDRSECAVILFDRPLVWLPDPEPVKGMLYGGRIMRDGEWWDFALLPGGGIETALVQRGGLLPAPTSAFVERHAFHECLSVATGLAAEVMGGSGNGFALLGAPGRWSTFLA